MAERTENKEKNILLPLYGDKAFLKIKQCLEIGKIQFSFVNKKNPKQCIDCYMEAEEFGACLMKSIEDKSLIRAILEEKAKGDKYPKAVWTSPVGGNATGNNGKPVSRFFEISPSTKYDLLFTAKAYPAEKNKNGAYIKEKDSKPIFEPLRIPCTFNDLKILQYKWSFLEEDYMRKKYCMENMKSTYSPSVSDADESRRHYYDEPDNTSNSEENQKNAENKPKTVSTTEMIELIATTELMQVKNKNIKICEVTAQNGCKYRLICFIDKIHDNKFPEFEKQLKARVESNKTLKFKANVCKKENDLYLLDFA